METLTIAEEKPKQVLNFFEALGSSPHTHHAIGEGLSEWREDWEL